MKILKYSLLGILIFIVILGSYFFTPLEIPFLTGFIGSPPHAKQTTWGVNFSQKHSENLGLDWKENYLALIDDLEVKNLKLLTQWNLIELEEGKYKLEDLDWQIKEAENRNINLILVIGIKTGRWPECHLPEWAKNLGKFQQQKRILALLEKIVLRYKNFSTIKYWQVENEPFFSFGECPWTDKNFLREEIKLVKTLDFQNRPIIITDAGELSFWTKAAKYGDILGITMYRKVWIGELGFYFHHILPPTFYWRKAQIIKKLFDKETIVGELQAEPWGPKLLYELPAEEQIKTMDLTQFKKNIEFAKKTGFDTFYLWGGEWWYWLKKKQNNSDIWNEARKLFTTSENL